MRDELTNQDLIDIIEDSLPDDRREVVRRVLRENPDLARRLKALHDDRDGLRSMARADAGAGAPAGLVEAALGAAKSGAGLRLVHDGEDAPRGDRSRHRRPALTRARWPVAVAAMVVLSVLGGVSYLIIQNTSPETRRERRLADVKRMADLKLSAGETAMQGEAAMNDGVAAIEGDNAAARDISRQIDALTKAREGDAQLGPVVTPSGELDLADLDLGLDSLLAEGVRVQDALDASNLTVTELGLALLEGRAVVTARSAAPERVLLAAADLDGTGSAEGAVVAVRGLRGITIDGDRIDLAKPAPTPAQESPGGLPVGGPIGEVEVVFGAASDRAIGGAYAEFKGLLNAIARVSSDLVIEIDADAPARRVAPTLDAASAVWWEQGSEAWVVAMPASFRLVVEPRSSDTDRAD